MRFFREFSYLSKSVQVLDYQQSLGEKSWLHTSLFSFLKKLHSRKLAISSIVEQYRRKTLDEFKSNSTNLFWPALRLSNPISPKKSPARNTFNTRPLSLKTKEVSKKGVMLKDFGIIKALIF